MCVSTYLHGNSDLPPNVSEGAIPVVMPEGRHLSTAAGRVKRKRPSNDTISSAGQAT